MKSGEARGAGPLTLLCRVDFLLDMLGRFGRTPLVFVMERSPRNCEVDSRGGERRLCSLGEKPVRRLRAAAQARDGKLT